jgi:hypothetical protein
MGFNVRPKARSSFLCGLSYEDVSNERIYIYTVKLYEY